jgi:hypothetical protein
MQFTVIEQYITHGVCPLLLVAVIGSVALPAAAQAPPVDGNLPSYTPRVRGFREPEQRRLGRAE